MQLPAYYLDIIVPNMLVTNAILLTAFFFIYRNYAQIRLTRRMAMLLTKGQRAILIRYFPFYRTLCPEWRQAFEARVIHFMYTKDYTALPPLQLTEKMGVLTAAYAAQLTFGMKDFQFRHFRRVCIYPDRFYSKAFGRHKSWELDDAGVFCFSWKHFYKELRSRKTISPVGLRIMAHAIKVEHKKLEEACSETVNPVRYLDVPDYARIKSRRPDHREAGEHHLFTERDLSTKENFLAACLICFFSRPVAFKNQYPLLYAHFNQQLYQQVVPQVS